MVRPEKKRRGRPPSGGRDPLVSARLPPELTERIDSWAINREVSRSEAIRRLVEQALDAADIAGRRKGK